jgi:hypothetical protein
MDPNRKLWNEQQKKLRQALESAALSETDRTELVELFLHQHAMLHDPAVSGGRGFSFEAQVWDGLSETGARLIPPGEEHSVAWAIWHLARIEDVTMNLLLVGRPQLLLEAGWLERMGVPFRDTGNAMGSAEIARLSTTIDLKALRAYRRAVGESTRRNVQELKPGMLNVKVDPARLEQARLEGAVTEAAVGLLEYWGGLTLAGLLLMPPTRHNFVHLTEAVNIKQKALVALAQV